MPLKWAELDPPASDEECRRWSTPALIQRARNSAARRESLKSGPTHRLRCLAYQHEGSQNRFPQYTRPAQLSAAIQGVSIATGAIFSCSTERDLVNGEPCAVIVTLTKRATRGRPPSDEG